MQHQIKPRSSIRGIHIRYALRKHHCSYDERLDYRARITTLEVIWAARPSHLRMARVATSDFILRVTELYRARSRLSIRAL